MKEVFLCSNIRLYGDKMYNSSLELIGNGPLILLNSIMKKYNFKGNLYAKYEGFNLTGSIKDKAVITILKDLEEKSILLPNMKIVEATSGNTGISLALIGHLLGYKVIIVMPENMSLERKKIILKYQAKLILTPKEEGMAGAIKKAKYIANEENTIYFNQFYQKGNIDAHYKMTAREIDLELKGHLDTIICGIGSAGTIMGLAKYFKRGNLMPKIIGIEPASSPFISEGINGSHKIAGIGAGFYPPILDRTLIDDIIKITDDEACLGSKILLEEEGLFCGISSGASLMAAMKFKNKENILIILPDNGYRYISY